MKRKIVIVILGIVLLAGLSQAVVFTDDFEDGDVSDWIMIDPVSATTGDPVWAAAGGVLSQTTAALDLGRPGAIALAPVGTVFNPQITVDVRADEDSAWSDVSLLFAYVDDTENYYVGLLQGHVEVRKGPDNVMLHDEIISSITPLTWHTVDLAFDSATGGLVVSVDGVEKLNKTFVDLVGISGQVGVGSQNDAASFDNYSVIPEPATMVLLGLGGLAVLKRRRG